MPFAKFARPFGLFHDLIFVFQSTDTASLIDYPTIIIGRKGSVGAITYAPQGGWPIDTTFYVEPREGVDVSFRYLFYALSAIDLARHTITTSIPGLNRDDLYATIVYMPPLAEQWRIAAVLDKAATLRRQRQQAIAKLDTLLQAVFLDMFGDPVTNPKGWEVKKLREVGEIVTGNTPSSSLSEKAIPPNKGNFGVNFGNGKKIQNR
jgi:type I restriction enzyme, S subunit